MYMSARLYEYPLTTTTQYGKIVFAHHNYVKSFMEEARARESTSLCARQYDETRGV